MSDHNLLAFLLRVLKVFAFDNCDELFWRTDGEYAPITVWVNCNDLFYWGTADVERVTPENIELLEATFAECKALSPAARSEASSLFCARARRMRPQNCCYADRCKEIWPLYDACGPEREVGALNGAKRGAKV